MTENPQQAGGNARAAKLSPERRSEIAAAAIKARWGKPGAKVRTALATFRRRMHVANMALKAQARAAVEANRAVERLNEALGDLEKVLPKDDE